MLVLRDIDVLVSEIDAAVLWGWAIDLARPVDPAVAYSLDIAGWVLGRDAPAVAVEFGYDGGVFQRVPSQDVRPDVATAARETSEAGERPFSQARAAGAADPLRAP